MPTQPNSTKRHFRPGRVAALPLFLVSAFVAARADAQSATNAKPLPNVLLLVDNSGSMERMYDNSLPSQNAASACSPGVATNPNRWGALIQALTGNMQPYYSCDAIARTSNAAFKNEFSIYGVNPYDDGYFLPYHRPLTGSSAATACALAPYKMSGVGTGTPFGPGRIGAGGDATDFPTDAFTAINYAALKSAYASGSNLPISGANACTFDQARDGQLDAARDYVRFGLMTFDNDINDGIGVTVAAPPSGQVSNTAPFLGMWTYRATSSSPFPALAGATGLPVGCATAQPWAVGARHNAAPPWEGRMVPFPAGNAALSDIQLNNDRVQQVLLGSRAYGATPIDGLIFDAKDYLTSTTHPFGPMGPNGDDYVKQKCRTQSVILLTDGAPNLSMRPACEGTGGTCPFTTTAIQTAKTLYDQNPSVVTYVIGFSVNGQNAATDGFPTALVDRTCRGYQTYAGGTPQALQTTCTSTPPKAGTTADACCQLNNIAFAGSGGLSGAPLAQQQGAIFVESQADLVLAFGKIMAGVTRDASTRTVPSYSPAVDFVSASAGQVRAGEFIASFIPSAQRVWSGEIDRTRSYCVGSTPTPQTQSTANGDSYAFNLASQAGQNQRLVITAQGSQSGIIDSAGTIRPWTTSTTYTDALVDNGTSTELAEKPGGGLLSSLATWPTTLNVDSRTCKRMRVTKNQTVTTFPALTNPAQCADAVWAFATSRSGLVSYSGQDFNFRCASGAAGAGASSGTCSISNIACSLGGSSCPTGEVCVPACSALGAIFRSNPVIVGPPEGLLRDDGYRTFAQQHTSRRPTMFVSTTDGVLHAFKALAAPDITDDNFYELWGFVPPAVLPNLASNFPTGQQILLDGSPVVKDVVWSRQPGADPAAQQWKTTLVSGLGYGGAGYYALNVTDPDCGGLGKQPCTSTFTAATSYTDVSQNEKGPHFLWQLTDLQCNGACGTSDDPAKRTRTAPNGKKMVALFGSQTGTPAITQVQIDIGEGVRQYGVALLPGGIDGAPVNGGSCLRGTASGAFNPGTYEVQDTAVGRRSYVRQWASSCSGPVPGRSLTVVRLDTGEIIRHFGRKLLDAPAVLGSLVTNSPFDSPVTGTPVVFPNVLGANAQRAYVGDADGTIWRVDLSDANPANWKVQLFHDMAASEGNGPAAAAMSQPLTIPLSLSVDPVGEPLISAATGDQENITYNTTVKNWVASIGDKNNKAKVYWSQTLTNGERVTGPMAVFDRTLYFASFRPGQPVQGQCSKGGEPYLWGVDYLTSQDGNQPSTQGGAGRWCKLSGSGTSNVDQATGTCTGVSNIQNEAVGAALGYAIIPGVTVRQTLSCASQDVSGDPAYTGMTATEYQLSFGRSDTRSTSPAGAVPAAARSSLRIARPRTPARLDAWAYVID